MCFSRFFFDILTATACYIISGACDVYAFIVKENIDLVQALDNRHLDGLHEAIRSTIQPRILQGQSVNLLPSLIEHTP